MENNLITIFFSCDDAYVPFLAVSLESLEQNASKEYLYNIKILNTNTISKENQNKIISKYKHDNFEIEFVDITEKVKSIDDKLHTRDYYSKSTYYRLFIPTLYANLDKALYLDSDIVVKGNIANLFNTDIEEYYVGAINDGAIVSVKEFQHYAEKVVGVDNYTHYFNAGILLMNLKKMREIDFENKFIALLTNVNFTVAQDQDYLNAICKGNVKFIDDCWNKMPFEFLKEEPEKINLIHYNLSFKPWHIDGVLYGEIFWEYAKKTNYYDEILTIKKNYNQVLINKADKETKNLIIEAEQEANNDELNKIIARKIRGVMSGEIKAPSDERLSIIKKIEEFERNGIFDKDVEDDPPTYVLTPEKIDYLSEKFKNKINTKISYTLAKRFLKKNIKNDNLIVKEIIGIENLKNLKSGAIITCNHFNPFDNFTMHYVMQKAKIRKKKLYTVIREGNYTNFPGFFGYLMRHCYTLPLSSDRKTMEKFLKSVDTILTRGDFVLVYPEQSMWWNYKKPKPLKKGAFNFAVRNNVPVLPCFITMKDTDKIGEDGFPIQEYTVHIEKPILIDEKLSKNENIDEMLQKNFEIWKKCYEETYKMPLEYLTKKAISN